MKGNSNCPPPDGVTAANNANPSELIAPGFNNIKSMSDVKFDMLISSIFPAVTYLDVISIGKPSNGVVTSSIHSN